MKTTAGAILLSSLILCFWWSELESNQPFGLFGPALIRLSYPTRDIADWPSGQRHEESRKCFGVFIFHPSSFRLHPCFWSRWKELNRHRSIIDRVLCH